MTVARHDPRNRKITAITSTIAAISVNCTSATEARMVSVRSVTTLSATPVGSERSSCGSASLMSATVCTMFAPGCRCTSSTTAARPFRVLMTRLFSTPDTTLPTSRRRSGPASR